MSDRKLILDQIRDSLKANRAQLLREAAIHSAPHPHGPFVLSDRSPMEQFIAELEALNVHVHACAGAEQAREQVRSLLASHNVQRVLHWDWDQIPLEGVEQIVGELGITSADGRLHGATDPMALLQELEPVPLCISGVDAAIAESGTLVVMSGRGRGRLASLLPPVHLAIVPADRVVRTLPDAFALLYERYGAEVVRERSNVTLISGPSRTADIEQSLTLGVHGPKEIHVVIVN
jgi:L-lactate dehydrogenase complex protein LldG